MAVSVEAKKGLRYGIYSFYHQKLRNMGKIWQKKRQKRQKKRQKKKGQIHKTSPRGTHLVKFWGFQDIKTDK